jgi:hypothetical protein
MSAQKWEKCIFIMLSDTIRWINLSTQRSTKIEDKEFRVRQSHIHVYPCSYYLPFFPHLLTIFMILFIESSCEWCERSVDVECSLNFVQYFIKIVNDSVHFIQICHLNLNFHSICETPINLNFDIINLSITRSNFMLLMLHHLSHHSCTVPHRIHFS